MYETTFLVNASLDDHHIQSTIAKVQDTIEKNGGQIKAVEKIGRKRLAYPINKKNNGFFVSIEFVSAGNVVNQLNRFYQFEENVLRFLNVVVDKNTLKARQLSPAESENPSIPARSGSEKERTGSGKDEASTDKSS